MATIDVKDVAETLGISIDEDNPTESLRAVFEALKDKASNGEHMSETLQALAGKVEEILAMPALQPPPPEPPDKRRAADTEPEVLTATELDRVLYGDNDRSPEQVLRDASDAAYIMASLPADKGLGKAKAAAWLKRTLEHSPARQYIDAMGAEESGYGAEVVPTGMSSEIWRDIQLQTVVASNLTQVPMPTNPYLLPYFGAGVTAYLTSEATDKTPSRIATEQDTLTAKGFGCALYFSGELVEDAVAPVAPLIRADMARVLAEGLESAVLDGDTAGTHQDADVTAALDVRKAWNGFRKLGLAQTATKTDGASFAESTIRAARAELGKWGVSPGDLMLITGPAGYADLLGLDEVLTVDKYGSGATILTGELGRVFGIPIIVSGQVRENLNASGVYDGSTATKTSMILVNRRQFVLGSRRQITIEDDKFILGDYTLVVAKARWAFASRVGVTAAHPTLNVIYNV